MTYTEQIIQLQRQLLDDIISWTRDNLEVIDTVLVGNSIKTKIQGELLEVHKDKYNKVMVVMMSEQLGWIEIEVDIENRYYKIEDNYLLSALNNRSGKLI